MSTSALNLSVWPSFMGRNYIVSLLFTMSLFQLVHRSCCLIIHSFLCFFFYHITRHHTSHISMMKKEWRMRMDVLYARALRTSRIDRYYSYIRKKRDSQFQKKKEKKIEFSHSDFILQLYLQQSKIDTMMSLIDIHFPFPFIIISSSFIFMSNL